jgi:hypothetical protein
VCKLYELDKDLLKCASRRCGKYYHRRCVGSPSLRGDEKLRWRCPCHTCKACDKEEEEAEELLWCCFRCPSAFHERCRPLDVNLLEHKVFSCIRHLMVGHGCLELCVASVRSLNPVCFRTGPSRPCPPT